MRARIEVVLKPGVLDVQGKAIRSALQGLGFSGVGEVRVGKTIAFDIEAEDREAAEAEVRAMCDRLLANVVIEDYRVDIA